MPHNALLKSYLRLLVTEAITHQPTYPLDYITKLANDLDRLRTTFVKAAADILQQDEDELNDWLRYGTSRWVRPGDLEDMRVNVDKAVKETVEQQRGILSFITKTHRYEQAKFLGYITQRMEYFLKDNHYNVQRAAEIADYLSKLEETLPEYESLPARTIDNLKTMLTTFNRLRQRMEVSIPKIKELTRALSAYEEKDLRPAAEKVETLYHVTTNADAIYRTGFSAEVPTLGGLGGSTTDASGKQRAVSFSSNSYVAAGIYRALVEAIKIARGELSYDDVIRMARTAGVEEPILKYAKLDQKDPTNRTHVFEVYRAYLIHAEGAKKRYDPLFFGNTEQMVADFATKSPGDVGILECDVDMTNPNILYLRAMDEYRVPVQAILKINRILRRQNP